MIRRLLLGALGALSLGAVAHAQPVTIAQPRGCVVGLACTAASLTVAQSPVVTLTTSQAQASGGSTLLPFASTTGVVVGQVASGTSIPAGDQVASIVSTATITQAANGAFLNTQKVIPMATTAGFDVGQQCRDNTKPTAIGAGNVIASIQANVSITLTSNVTAASMGAADSITCDPVVTLATTTSATVGVAASIQFSAGTLIETENIPTGIGTTPALVVKFNGAAGSGLAISQLFGALAGASLIFPDPVTGTFDTNVDIYRGDYGVGAQTLNFENYATGGGFVFGGGPIYGLSTDPNSLSGQLGINLNASGGLPSNVDTSADLVLIGKDSAGKAVSAYGFGTGSATIFGYQAGGTKASPSATQADQQITTLSAGGYGATGWVTGAKAQFRMEAAEAWTDTAAGTYLDFFTTAKTTLTLVDRWRITDAGVLESAAGNPIAWNSGAGSGGSPDTGLSRVSGGVVGVGTGAQGSVAGTLSLATIINGGITSDATHTDAAVCEDTTSHQFYSGSGTLGVCLGTSSARFKHDVAALQPGLAQIMALEPISYKLNADHGDPDKVLYGFTAEQMQPILPALVGLDNDGEPNTADYTGLIPVLVKAIQEQQAEIEALKAQLVEEKAQAVKFAPANWNDANCAAHDPQTGACTAIYLVGTR